METRSGVFAVAIIVLLLMALTMNAVSAESKAKVKLGPFDTEKVKLNHSDAAKVKLNHSDAAKEKLNHSDVAKEELNHSDAAMENLNHSDAAKENLNHSDAAKENLNHSDAAMENLNHTDLAKVALNPSESMTFPTERALNELIYDDGTAEDAYAWSSAGNGFAVQFTPPTYPVDLRTARICFWPDWPDSNHEKFAVYVYDDDGPSGEPGTCLGGPIYHTATAWGWCNVDISGPGITIENGDFYILYKQLTSDPDCEGLCRDLSPPQYGRSWDYYYDGSWDLWNAENYMIRCVVDDDTTDEWTYLVYLDGDNNLEGAAIDDFMEMSAVGSTSAVNIVVQFDRIPDYDTSYGDWTDCKRFHVTYGMTPTAANAIENLGECNMGNPNTLTEFVEWAMTEYPAENYALILWNHGSGWKLSVPWMETKGICWDSTSNDHLTLQETGQALSGKYVDLLGNDACLMQMIEVAYQMRTSAGIIVGSEETEPWDGWPYDTILSDLTGTPTMSPSTFGETIVSRYIEYYPAETLSAMNNGDLPGLATAVDNFAQVLIGKLPGNYNEIEEARTNVQVFYDPDYIDLYHFAELIKSSVPGTESAAQAVMDNVDTVVYADAHGSAYQNAHGLTVYYPKNEWSYWTSYENTDFAINTNWDEFLMKYYEGPSDAVLSLSPESHNFGDMCEYETDSTTFDVWNSGTGTLTYSLSETCGWVDVHPTSGSSTGEHDTITIDIDTTGLFEGSHTCDISISSNGGSGTFTVTVNVVSCECDGTATSCGIYPNCENCNEDDGCYPYGNGCEERDYYCVSNEAGCSYTYSNRHTDDWVDTGNTDWVTDPGNDCREKEQKEQKYRDYYCSGGACTYNVTGTQWVDTGTTRNKPEGTICGCTASNTLKKCYSGVCTDTGICDATTCGADAACDGKVPGDSCGGGGICDSNCKCGGPAVGEDIAVYIGRTFYINTNLGTSGEKGVDLWYNFGVDGAKPLVGDFDQDGYDDIAVYIGRTFYISTNLGTSGEKGVDLWYNFGVDGAKPLVGDFNRDGYDDIAVYIGRTFYINTNLGTSGEKGVDLWYNFGVDGAKPLVGDFNRDGYDDIAVYIDRTFYISTNLGTSGEKGVDLWYNFGVDGAKPLVGDFDQDGYDDIAVYIGRTFYISTNLGTSGEKGVDLWYNFGQAGAIPLVGDIG